MNVSTMTQSSLLEKIPVTNIAEIDFIFHQALQESVVSLHILLYISLQHLCVYIVVAEL